MLRVLTVRIFQGIYLNRQIYGYKVMHNTPLLISVKYCIKLLLIASLWMRLYLIAFCACSFPFPIHLQATQSLQELLLLTFLPKGKAKMFLCPLYLWGVTLASPVHCSNV